jgi:pimeloyl-ACP methyl ester carboxylesterase
LIGPVLLATALKAQVYQAGPQVLTFFSDVDDTDQPYALYLPKRFDVSRKYPLVMSLHGAWSNHRLNLRRVFGRGNRPGETDAEASRYFPPLPDVDFVVASPLSRGTMGYQGIAERDVYDVLADVKKRFPIDEDRIYLTGLSMGGGGTLWLGLTRPDMWAAIAAVCPAPPPEADVFAGNALHLPVRLYQGAIDPVVPVESTRSWHKRMLSADTQVEYIEYPAVRHNAWDFAYRDAAVFSWFAQFRRTSFPDRVRFTTDRYKYAAAYWVRIDALSPGTPARIDARFAGANQLEIATEGLDAFTLSLAGHPKYSAATPLRATVDGVALRVRLAAAVSFNKTPKGWQAANYVRSAGEKRLGAEGPAAETTAGRHIYVYGTTGTSGAGEIERRRLQAAAASNWSSPRIRLLLSPKVMADKDVTAAELLTANLVLFGTKETNQLIDRFADRFPLELNAGAADYGLVFVAAVDNRYILVNSGLPWWTGTDLAPARGWPFLPPIYRELLEVGDYALFKGSFENMIAAGRFDRNWRVGDADRSRMLATGAIRLRGNSPHGSEGR